MAKIKGICKNIDGDCSLAFNRTVQEAEKDDFVCSECGEPLKEATNRNGGGHKRNKLVPIVAGAAVLLAAVGGTGYGLGWFSTDKPATEQAEKVDATEKTAVAEEPKDEAADTTVTATAATPPEQTAVNATEEPVEQPAPKAASEPAPKPAPANGRNLGYGKYVGEYPTGTGVITLTRNHTFETVNGPVEAKAGETIVGVKFKDGKLIQGELHRADGTRPFLQFGAI